MVLTARFAQAEVYALPGVAEVIRAAGTAMLGRLRPTFGDRLATRVMVPTRALAVGAQTIAGTCVEVTEYRDAESDVQLVALLPDQRVLLAFDLVFGPHDHVFAVAPRFEHWIAILEELQATSGYDTIVIGHDAPTDRAAYDATIAYLRRAREIHARAKDAQSYADGLKTAFPERRHPDWADGAGRLLYAAPPEPVT